jgi:hypothetical protein
MNKIEEEKSTSEERVYNYKPRKRREVERRQKRWSGQILV